MSTIVSITVDPETRATQVRPVIVAFLAPRSAAHSGEDFCIVADPARSIAVGNTASAALGAACADTIIETSTQIMLDRLIETYRRAGYTVHRMSNGEANVDSLAQAAEFGGILTAITRSDRV